MIIAYFFSAFANEIVFEGALGGTIADVVVSEDQKQVAFIGSNMSYLLSVLSWEVTEISACGTSSMGGGAFVDNILYIGCDDGSISSYDGTSITQNAFTINGSSIMGLWSKTTYLYALAKSSSGGNPKVHSINLSTGQESAGNYPSTLGYSSYKDAEIIGNYLVISQGGSSASKVDLSTGAATRDNQGPTAVSYSDVLVAPSATNALIAGGNGGIVRFITSSNDTQYALNLTTWTNVTALALFGSYIWLADDQTLRAHDVSQYGATVGADERMNIPVGHSVLEMGVLPDHLVYASADGSYGIISSLPWVEISSLSQGTDGNYRLMCSSSVGGTYEVFLGDFSGTSLATGTIDADIETEIVFAEPSGLIEGENRIWIDVEGGYDSTVLEIDTPPDAVILGENALVSGNQKLTLQFSGLTAADIEFYQVYVSTEEFTSSTYETGGPDGSILSEDELLITGSDQIVVELYPLENNVRYFVGVRAIDKAGTEGPMSNVVSGTPKMSYGIADLSGESGGFSSCAHMGGIEMSWLMCILLGIASRKRALSVAVAVMGFHILTQEAQAADAFGEAKPVFTKAFSVDFSRTKFASEAIQVVLGEDTMCPGVNLGASMQIFRVLELSSGLGLWRQSGLMVQEDGTSSSDKQTMSILPFQLSAGLRLDFFRNQAIVPFARGGIDYWLWQEDWKNGETTEKISGGKSGWHYRFGAEVLLDIFDKSSASMLDVRYRIKNTYLVFSYQKQEVGDDGLIFNGESYMLGLRMQY